MSSTYVHYSAPSSLPSDYGVLAARFGGTTEDNMQDPAVGIGSLASARPRSRSPQVLRTARGNGPYVPVPSTAKIVTGPSIPNAPTEATPLLNVPRIVEDVDEEEALEAHGAAEPKHHNIYWEEMKILSKYSLPVVATHVLEYSLVVSSVVSIGHLSTTALAAATLGSMTASVTGLSIVQGFVSTLDTMLPSAWTSGEPRLVGLWSQRMSVVLAIILVPILAVWFNAEAALLALRQEPEVARLAGLYLKWLSLGLPAYAFNSVARRYFQSQGLFTVPTNIILIVAPINALLNYLLVWGPPPIRLGFIGAPIANSISFNLISVANTIYGIYFVPHTAWHPLTSRAFKSLGILVQLGTAGVGQVASEWWSWELVGLAASQLGPVALATQSVLLVSCSMTFQAPYSLSIATSVRIGNLLGEKNPKRAKVSSQVAFVLTLLVAAFLSSLFVGFRDQWALMFNNDPEVVALTSRILPLCALFQVFDGLQGVCAGIMRACGRQFLGAMLNLSAYYVIGIPFGIYLAFSQHLGLGGLWIGLTLSLVYCATLGVYVCLIRTDWEYELGKVEARLEADRKADPQDEERLTQ